MVLLLGATGTMITIDDYTLTILESWVVTILYGGLFLWVWQIIMEEWS